MASLHGYEIVCDRELGRLDPSIGDFGPIRVRAAATSPLHHEAELIQLVTAGGAPRYAVARAGSRLVSWHADAGSFEIDPAGRRICYFARDIALRRGQDRWGDRLGSTAVPLLAAELGGLALHASANLVGGGCLLVCGVTGRGKSTMAAALAAQGHPLLAEDGAVVHWSDDRPMVWPGLRDVLITPPAADVIGATTAASPVPDHRGRILHSVRAADGPAPVTAVVILAERGGPRLEIERLSPARGHRELLAHALSTGRRASAFAAAARLVERVPVSLVTAPDRLDALEDVVGEVAGSALSDRLAAPKGEA